VYTEEEAADLVRSQSRDGERWVQAMMVDELGLLRDERRPLLSGLTTLGAFLAAGSVPLLFCLLALLFPLPAGVGFPVSVALTACALFGLGAAKVVVTGLGAVRSGLEMLLVGGLAAGAAYAVGALLKGLAG
jgi:VIT1/CCC1 family predicted Fe2+/Mn2+ transporter